MGFSIGLEQRMKSFERLAAAVAFSGLRKSPRQPYDNACTLLLLRYFTAMERLVLFMGAMATDT